MKQHLKQHLLRTWKNKAVALVLLAINLGITLLTLDITFLVMMLPIILALFFAKRDHIDLEDLEHDE